MTVIDMLPHVRRLNQQYRKRMKPEDIEHQAREFAAVLERFGSRQIELAVGLVIRREPHYPTPQKLFDAAAEVRRAEPPPRPPVSDEPYRCPGCGTEDQRRVWPIMCRSRADSRPRWSQAAPEYQQAHRWLCDCAYRASLTYQVSAELALMGDDDPFVADERRTRAQPQAGRP